MTHNDLIERVARAMAKDANDHFDQVRLFYMKRATAALAEVYAALREPTPEMLDESWRQSGESREMRERYHQRIKRHFERMLQASPLNPEN